MRRWLLIVGLLGCLGAQAQSPVWALKGTHNTVYLAGSVHLLKKEDTSLPPSFERAYASAKTLVMEVDIDDVDSPAAQALVLQKGMFADGSTLRDSIGAARFDRVAAEAQRLGLPIEGLQQFEPWAVALTLTQLEYLQLGFDPDEGVERQLGRRAHADGKQIQGLETLEQQIDILASLSKEDQAAFLEQTVTEMHDADRETQEILAAWRSGNAAKLAALMSRDFQSFPSLYRALVTDRNRRWLPQIERLLKSEQNYLVIVGALHLVGDGGLLQLARAEGLEPRPLQ
jgi:uncharacterized protein YbaP (TraB family)